VLKNNFSNWSKLNYRKPLVIKGYDTLYHEQKLVVPQTHVQLQINDISFEDNYNIFREKLMSAINKKYFPIYRMADGEFKFVQEISSNRKCNRILRLWTTNNIQTCWGEDYTQEELKNLENQYANDLREISLTGLLALHFIDFDNYHHPYYKLYKKIADWFDSISIKFDPSTITSFYYIYIILTGPDRSLLLRHKRILIFTSVDNSKRVKINNYLLNGEGVQGVEFYPISPSKSMLEKLDLSRIKSKPDLILIGAGIGSSNILAQLKPLQTLCIDAGIVIERYADSSLSKSRIFLL
jgi:hypothetical protein